MNILIAPDKFKGSLTAQQVCDAVVAGIFEVYPDWVVEKIPMADGGEGTCELLTSISGGSKVKTVVRDPLFREIEAEYGLSPDGRTAFIDMASASGLNLLKPEERNPRMTSTIGTGDLIRHALKNGANSIVLGCGGSATNDGGIGMMSALGFSFLDFNGEVLQPIGDHLSKIESVEKTKTMKGNSTCQFTVITDVDNPLFGPRGAAQVFGPQKGASPTDVLELDKGLRHLAKILEKQTQSGITNFPGAGAAGGLAVCARAFLNAELKSGIDFIMDHARIEQKIMKADLIITGEGQFDQQSLHGKVISGIARECRRHNKRLWVICGVSEIGENETNHLGIEKILSIASIALTKEESMNEAGQLIRVIVKKAISSA